MRLHGILDPSILIPVLALATSAGCGSSKTGGGGATTCDPVAGGTYYVDPVSGSDGPTSSGSNSAGGQTSAACALKTIAHAVAVVGSPPSATTIVVLGGPANAQTGETFPVALPDNVTVRGSTAAVTVQVSAGVTGFVLQGGSGIASLTIDGLGVGSHGVSIGGVATLDGVSVQDFADTGIVVDGTGAQLSGQGLAITNNGSGGLAVLAGRADLGGATRIVGNHGGTPVAFGVKVAPGAILTLTGANGAPVAVDGNDGVGVVVLGNFQGQYVEAIGNGTQGVWVDTSDAPAFGLQNASLAAFDVSGNGANPGAYPPGGITVLQTRSTTASDAERFLLQQGAEVGTQSRVHDNLGDGITLGGDPTPGTGLCAILPSGLACGAVDGTVESTHVMGNRQGIVIQQQDSTTSGTVPVLFGNYIVGNAGVGLHVSTSFIPSNVSGLYINGNIIGSNGWDVACTGTESSPQVEFDGPVVASAAVTAACAAYLDETSCDADRANTCIYNPSAVQPNSRPSYPIGTSSCGDTTANSFSGYDRTGTENEEVKVAILVTGGAWVNVENDEFLTSQFQVLLDWTPIGSDSYASSLGTTCASAAQKCPAPF